MGDELLAALKESAAGYVGRHAGPKGTDRP